jgi:hypothetical protein
MQTVYERFDLQIEYVKEMVQLRVESLKIELDKINDDIQRQLDETKNELVIRLVLLVQ